MGWGGERIKMEICYVKVENIVGTGEDAFDLFPIPQNCIPDFFRPCERYLLKHKEKKGKKTRG